jgi:hypothetical protein
MRAITDQDVYYKERAKTREGDFIIKNRPFIKAHFPKLYYVGQKNKIYTVKNLAKTVIQGVVHAGVLFAATLLAMNNDIDSTGKSQDFWYFSITLYTSIILVVDLKLAIYTRYWTILSALTMIILSLFLYFGYIYVSDNIADLELFQSAKEVATTSDFYLIVFFNCGLIYLLDMTYLYVKAHYYTSLVDYFQYLIKKKKHNEEAAFGALSTTIHDEKSPLYKQSGMASESGKVTPLDKSAIEEKTTEKPSDQGQNNLRDSSSGLKVQILA